MQKGVSILDASLLVNGDIFSEGGADISGRFVGNIFAETVSIKAGGIVTGDIYTDELVVAGGGVFKGNIFAKRIKLLKGAEVEGNIEYSYFAIEDGAKIVGTCSNVSEDTLTEKLNAVKGNFGSGVKHNEGVKGKKSSKNTDE